MTHSAPWGWKSGARYGAPQVALRITVAPGKIRAGELQDGLDLRSGFTLREQMPGDPQIHDAPVRLRKAFENMPALQTTSVDGGGLFHAGWVGLCGCRVHREGPRWWRPLPDGGQQCFGARCQTHVGVHEFYPGSRVVRGASCGFLIGEAGEPSQVTPVRTSQVPSIDMRQVLACGGRQRRFQARGAEANPSLQMAGAGLQHHTRIMPVGTHEFHNHPIDAIQVDQNVACVLVAGVGLDVNVAAPPSCERAGNGG